MINKKTGAIIFGSIMLLAGIMFASAVCCEKLQGGAWCMTADDESACDSAYNVFMTQSCDAVDVPECNGVCVNEDSGECSENTGQLECSDELHGVWYEQPIEEIDVCQDVCCILGNEVAFANPTECKQLFTDYGISNGIIREDITDRDACGALGQSFEEGACVIETELEKTCVRTTEIECDQNYLNNLTGNLQLPFTESEIFMHWEKGYLCTAKKEINGEAMQLSDCAKSKNTICEDNKVYFTDNCGNKANVYDESKYEDDADYWTYIKNPSDENEVCQINGPSSTCGNCDTITSGTVCQAENEAQNTGNAQYGNLVCGDLSCNYNGIDYKHGESWCGGTEGTLVPILWNSSSGKIFQTSRNLLENYNDYNVPGSRYYKMICSFGEIIINECADYRNQVCVEDDLNEKRSASCKNNDGKTCFQYLTKTECENPLNLCKWVPGYTWNLTIANEKNEERRAEEQGSCVPLVAPGFDFWKATTQANAICSSATVQEYAMFETTWWVDRGDFAGWSDKLHSNRCINGCYAIPKYGTMNEEDVSKAEKCDAGEDCKSGEVCFTGYCVDEQLFNFYDESGYNLDKNVDEYYISDRKGQYCHKDGKPDEWLTGPVTGSSYDCASGFGNEDKDERKERDFPLFLTHKTWLDSITERARSLGDCGYKSNINGDYSEPETEIITAIFEKLKQSGEVKETITAEQIIYKAGVWVGDEGEIYNEGLYDTTHYTCSEQGGYCIVEFNAVGGENCPGEKIESEEGSLCPNSMVCCAGEILE